MATAQTDVDDVVDTLTMSDVLVMTVRNYVVSYISGINFLRERQINLSYKWHYLTQFRLRSLQKTSRPAPSYTVAAPTQSVRFDSSRDIWGQAKKPSPARAPAELSSGSADLQLQLCRLELEERQLEAEREREQRARQHELQVKCLELGVQLPAPVAEGRSKALTEFADVFSDVLGKTNLAVHHIELLPNTQPIRCTPYRLHPGKSEFLQKELHDLLQLGIIEESDSPWASPIVMVPL